MLRKQRRQAKGPSKGRAGRRRRRHAGAEQAGGPEAGGAVAATNAWANLGAGISTVAWFARQFPTSEPPDPAMCEKYGRDIEERCGVRVDDPELARLLTVCRSRARRQRFLDTAAVYGPKLAARIETPLKQLRKFFERYPDAQFALGVAPEDLPPRSVVSIATPLEQWATRGERLAAWLRGFGFPPPERKGLGRIADADLNATAAAVAESMRRRTGKVDWTAIAKILLCYRWNLRERLGRRDPEGQGARLRDRVRKMRKQGTIAAP